MLPIVVLIWRLYISRKRKIFATLFEIIFPLAIFLTFLFIKMKFENPATDLQADPQSYPVAAAPLRVVYTPDTQLTYKLMREAGRRLFLKLLSDLPDELEEGIAAIPENANMKEYIETMEVGDAIVIFQNLNGSNWPKTLNYTIRMKSRLRPQNLVKVVIGSVLPQDQFDTIYEPFIRLQWALDTSFLQLSTGTYINPILTLQAEAGENLKFSNVPLVNPLAIIHCTVVNQACRMALFIPVLYFIMRMADEKNSGILELIKLSSISDYTLSVLHYINMVPVWIVFAFSVPLCLKLGAKPVIPQTSYFLLALILTLMFWSVIAFAAFITSLFVPKRPFAFGMIAYAVIAFFLSSICDFISKHIGRVVQPLLSLMPLEPARWAFKTIGLFEYSGQGAEFGKKPGKFPDGNKPLYGITFACIYMAVQTPLYFYMGVVMSRLQPGPYGESQDGGICKVFPKHVALANLSLDVFRGEITLLLGHNGAGKTTLMNIITGLYGPTTGKVEINGLDVVSHRSQAYREVGLCPQHNLFFNDLTVKEHAMIFAMLKGLDIAKATDSATAIIKELGLVGKENNLPSTLSGGMKRRAQLACALVGNSSVLILDEPTSGLDVETRRELWDLLLSLRGDRTVLLTTHFMEEADALGDRVAALHSGHLKCHATPMFLKKAVGGGYRLTITTAEEGQENDITKAIQSKVANAVVTDRSHKVITYNLPSIDSSAFPEMFANLEHSKESLGIVSIGVGRSTLDEVFIRLCSDTVTELEEITFPEEPTFQKETGICLYARMFVVLMYRQLLFVRANLISFVLMHAIMPIALSFAGGYVINMSIEGPKMNSLHLEPSSMHGESRAIYTVLPGSNAPFPGIGYEYMDARRMELGDLFQANDKKDYQIGIEYNDTHAKAVYGASVRHAAAVAVNLLSNSLARRWSGPNGTGISVLNHPLDIETELYDDETFNQKSTFALMLYSALLCFQYAQVITFSITLVISERITSTRHIHQMCGCPLPLYWIATLTFHLLAVLCFAILPNMIAISAMDEDNILNQWGFMLSSSLLGLICTFALMALYYSISTQFSEIVTSLLFNVVIIIFGMYSGLIEYMLETLIASSGDVAILEAISILFPTHNLILGVYKCGKTANLNAKCKILRRKCPNLDTNDLKFDDKRCCDSTGDYDGYFRMDSDSAGKELMLSCLHMVFYMWLLFMLDSGVFSALGEKWSRCNVNEKSRFRDGLVLAERQYVSEAIRKPRREVTEAVICYNVYKKYTKCCKPFMAVNGLNFAVKRCECYGLLGINGAGKSTTFKMLTAETYRTLGHIMSNGYYIQEKIPYMQMFSYCPQFFGLDDFLTGEQNLILVLTLRGLNSKDAKQQTASWLQEIGLTQYAEQCVSGYSGGCARRLAAVAALCQHSQVALLDEPTTGVDTAARRRVHAAVLRAKRTKSVIIASHSMDEIESLCDRIAIMSAGEVAALGSAAELRARHATGFSATFKLSAPTAIIVADKGTMAPPDEVVKQKEMAKAVVAAPPVGEGSPPPEHPEKQQFLDKMYATFDCRIVDDHRTITHIHINDLMPYSQLFEILEGLKNSFPNLIEDYVVSETTLEEVFIAIAKEGQEYAESKKQK